MVGEVEDMILSLAFGQYEGNYIKTLGGKVWWNELEAKGGYKLQQNIMLKKCAYLIVSLFVVVSLVFSLLVYMSLFRFVPWYDACGTQVLAVFIISSPVLLLAGIALKILSKKYEIHKTNVRFPFYAITCITLPVVVDGSLSMFTAILENVLCVVLVLIAVAMTVKNMARRSG